MRKGARKLEELGIPREKLIKPIGRILRKLHLDELAQLFNIIKGDMSFVGYRPLAKWDYDNHVSKDKKYKQIYQIKPGLMSLNNVLGYMSEEQRTIIMKKLRLKHSSIKSIHSKQSNEYHLKLKEREFFYLKHRSFILDLRIFRWTILMELEKIKKVISGKF